MYELHEYKSKRKVVNPSILSNCDQLYFPTASCLSSLKWVLNITDETLCKRGTQYTNSASSAQGLSVNFNYLFTDT